MLTHYTSVPYLLTTTISICTVCLYNFQISIMAIQTTYTTARANLAKLCDEVTENRRIVIISRRGRHDVALISADELSGLMETIHLLRSPKNAERLLTALNRAKTRKGKAKSITVLRKEVGLGQKE